MREFLFLGIWLLLWFGLSSEALGLSSHVQAPSCAVWNSFLTGLGSWLTDAVAALAMFAIVTMGLTNTRWRVAKDR